MPTKHTTPAPQWRKSSKSGGDSGQCVQAAFNVLPHILIGDSKDPSGPVLTFSPDDWYALVTSIKDGRLT